MKEIKNSTTRHLENDEYLAILEAVKILEKGFKKKVFIVDIKPNNQESTDVYALFIAFDLSIDGWK